MAGDNFKHHAQVRIVEFVENEIRNLLNKHTNRFQNANWDQAISLFVDIVIPCDLTYAEDGIMHNLARDILKKAKEHGNRVYYGRRDDPHKNMFNKSQLDYEFLHNTKIKSNILMIEDWLKKFKDWYD